MSRRVFPSSKTHKYGLSFGNLFFPFSFHYFALWILLSSWNLPSHSNILIFLDMHSDSEKHAAQMTVFSLHTNVQDSLLVFSLDSVPLYFCLSRRIPDNGNNKSHFILLKILSIFTPKYYFSTWDTDTNLAVVQAIQLEETKSFLF